jgi:hypothetical protein
MSANQFFWNAVAAGQPSLSFLEQTYHRQGGGEGNNTEAALLAGISSLNSATLNSNNNRQAASNFTGWFPPSSLGTASLNVLGGNFFGSHSEQQQRVTADPFDLFCADAAARRQSLGVAKRTIHQDMWSADAGAGGFPSANKRMRKSYESDVHQQLQQHQQQLPGFKKSLTLSDHPTLLNRIANLGGGLPMPKQWKSAATTTGYNSAALGMAQALVSQQQQRHTGVSNSSRKAAASSSRNIGKGSSGDCFPMPPLSNNVTTRGMVPPSLTSYHSLWESTSPKVRKMALAWRLQRGNVVIVDER